MPSSRRTARFEQLRAAAPRVIRGIAAVALAAAAVLPAALAACSSDAKRHAPVGPPVPSGVVPAAPRDAVGEGDLARREGRAADALAAYERAIAADRSDVRAQLHYVEALLADGRRSDARDRYAARLASVGATEAERVMAARLATDGSPPAVRAVYVEAAKRSPDNPWWRLALAEIDLASAESWIAKQEQARAAGDRPGADEAAATARRALDRAQSAVENADARSRGGTGTAATEEIAEIHLYRGLVRSLESDLLPSASARTAAQRAAADAFARAVAADPSLVDAWRNLGDARRRIEDPDGALAAYLAAARLAPSDPELRMGTGALLHGLGRDREAAEQFFEAARLAPSDASPLVAAGDALAASSKFEDALAAYGQALEREPSRVVAHRRRGLVLERLGRVGEARQEYATYLERGGPDSAAVRRRMERLLSTEASR